jgi:hypothetical protein
LGIVHGNPAVRLYNVSALTTWRVVVMIAVVAVAISYVLGCRNERFGGKVMQ